MQFAISARCLLGVRREGLRQGAVLAQDMNFRKGELSKGAGTAAACDNKKEKNSRRMSFQWKTQFCVSNERSLPQR